MCWSWLHTLSKNGFETAVWQVEHGICGLKRDLLKILLRNMYFKYGIVISQNNENRPGYLHVHHLQNQASTFSHIACIICNQILLQSKQSTCVYSTSQKILTTYRTTIDPVATRRRMWELGPNISPVVQKRLRTSSSSASMMTFCFGLSKCNPLLREIVICSVIDQRALLSVLSS